jgi:AraC-like DNA-binding protein
VTEVTIGQEYPKAQERAVLAGGVASMPEFRQPRSSAVQIRSPALEDRIALVDRPAGGTEQKQATVSAVPDPLIERLVRALLPQQQADDALRGFYTDMLHTTLVKRLAELRDDTAVGPNGRRLTRLPAWRLRRVYEHVENNLGGSLALTDLAAAAGISRMHFAAQFRLATGMTPHAYVTHRRILRAKTMLSRTSAPIVEVALSVGFKTQAHFTTVFRHFVGYPPRRWRMLRDEAAICQAA